MMAVLPEPGRTIVIVAAFTGLRKQEIKGLRWEDFQGDELHVQRSVFGQHVQETKTLASKAPVPVLPIVRKALEEHKKRTPDVGFIFAGAQRHRPLRVENLMRREMRPVLIANKIPWKGWQPFAVGWEPTSMRWALTPRPFRRSCATANCQPPWRSTFNPWRRNPRRDEKTGARLQSHAGRAFRLIVCSCLCYYGYVSRRCAGLGCPPAQWISAGLIRRLLGMQALCGRCVNRPVDSTPHAEHGAESW